MISVHPVFLALLATLAGMAGIVMLGFAPSSDKMIGVALLLFGAGMGEIYYGIRPYRDFDRLQVGVVSRRGAAHSAFIARSDRMQAVVPMIGLLSVGVGLLALLAAPSVWNNENSVVVVLGFGGALCLVAGAFGLFRGRRGFEVALTRDGVMLTGPGSWFAPWRVVRAARTTDLFNVPLLRIAVTDLNDVELSRYQKIASWSPDKVPEIIIPLQMFTVSPPELLAAIERYINDPTLRSRIGRTDELADIQAALPNPATNSFSSMLRWIGLGSLLAVGAITGLLAVVAAADTVRPDEQ